MGYILGRTLPAGTTRMAAKAALAAASTGLSFNGENFDYYID